MALRELSGASSPPQGASQVQLEACLEYRARLVAIASGRTLNKAVVLFMCFEGAKAVSGRSERHFMVRGMVHKTRTDDR